MDSILHLGKNTLALEGFEEPEVSKKYSLTSPDNFMALKMVVQSSKNELNDDRRMPFFDYNLGEIRCENEKVQLKNGDEEIF